MQVIVVGAGVVGLTTALVLAQNGHDVEVVAETIPLEDAEDTLKNDKDLVIYSSLRAGAVWRSFALKPPLENHAKEDADERLARWENVTFKMLWELAQDDTSGITRTEALELFRNGKPSMRKKLVFAGDSNVEPSEWTDPWFKDYIPGYEQVYAKSGSLPEGFSFGIRYETVVINPVDHLPYLLKKFKSIGTVTQRKISALGELSSPNVDCIVNCTGLGAAFLSDALATSHKPDRSVYPARGITLLLKSPTTRRHSACDDDDITYVIPRFDKDGTVILGGSYEPEKWTLDIPEKDIQRILTNCLAVDPSIGDVVGSEGKSKEQIVAELRRVVDVRSGMRPCRKGGVRVESEWRQINDKRTLVVHNYGHAGWGFQASFGCAADVLAQMDQAGLASKKRVPLKHEVQTIGLLRRAVQWIESKL
jgi:D-amino-acid oxidase